MLLALYLLASLLVGWRLVGVQVVSAADYRSLAERQTQRDIELVAPRGKLYDRSGQPLALSLTAATVYAHPNVLRETAEPGEVAAQLAQLLDSSEAELTERLGRDASFVYLGRQLPRSVGEQVEDLGLPGVGVLNEPQRHYPADGLAAQVLGFAGVDHTGLSGLELGYDDVLAGTPGRQRTERAPGGVTISAAPREIEPAEPGDDLVLTLDRSIQATAEQILSEAVIEYDAKGASAVVLDVDTGEILAMASAPGYDPDDVGDVDGYTRRNRTVTDVFEPGSVNKVITLAGALEEGLVEPTAIRNVPGEYTLGTKTFRDAHTRQTRDLSVHEIMVTSSNVGTIQIAQELGAERLHAYLRRFGYGQPTGLGFPGESSGLLSDADTWSGTSLPTIAIGQGLSATLLQVADSFAAIAGGGQWYEPTIVRGEVGPRGQLQPAGRSEPRRAVSPSTAEAVRSMLVDVVDDDQGTGRLAAVPGYAVAGKTGTAQKPSATRRGYEPGAYVGTFAGFAPADDPQVVVAVMVDEPTPIYGGLTAAPVFGELMEFVLTHRRIAPSHPEEDPTPGADSDARDRDVPDEAVPRDIDAGPADGE